MEFDGDRTVSYATTVDVLLEYRFAKAEQQPVAADNKADEGKKMVLPVSQTQGAVGWMASRFELAPPIFSTIPRRSRITLRVIRFLRDSRQRFVFLDIEKKF